MAGEWQQRDLGDEPLNEPVVAGTVNGRLLVVYATADGRIVGWSSSGDEFVSSDIASDTNVPLSMSNLAVYEGKAMIVGSGAERFVPPRVWVSTDGTTWSEVAATGLEQPADIAALAATPDTLYAAGSYQEGLDPAAGTFRPAIWRSADGQQWEAVTVPDVGAQGIVQDIVAGTGSVIVSVQGGPAALGGRPGGSIWRSGDRGTTWSQAIVDVGSRTALWTVESIARLGDQLVGVGSIEEGPGFRLLIVASSDDGRTWSPSPGSAALSSINGLGGDVVANVVATAGGALWIATSQFNDAFSNPDACYHDLRSCQGGAQPVLLRSTDGDNWVEIDLTALSISSIARLVDLPAGGLVLIGVLAGTSQLAAWTWPNNEQPPLRPPPPEPPPDEPPLATNGDHLTAGLTYRYPLFIHCGMGILGQFNDQWWILVEGSTDVDPELGAGEQPPPDWPIADQYILGTITLIDEDTIEYSIPSGQIIAVYEPATNNPQLCA